MKTQALILTSLLIGCNNPPVVQDVAIPDTKVALVEESTLVEEAAPEPEPEPEVKPEPPPKPKPKKKKDMSEGRCRKILYQFDQCGWRCTHRGGNPGRCIGVCRALLNSRTKAECLQIWGPGFG